ncbi:LYR motif-containing protein [Aspergillus mulundensis]|uniref:Mitochondrial zinc maintenance protein 1, mitochondrial n=1 Tax=Aspergillus mulundensis TaxID=1810919 RepID=A0A3D8QZJ7_9EURO|nr:Mitochondrial zinc maintenance protein 1, mitochondrial [Aspergillus mulundensis]RDW67233.1 Mitochondrial zinc maintenance protein 1, mitochondrial [Aspergillus mulundensis]
MSAQPAVSALSAYRQILRATRIAFHNDTRVLLAARQEARQNFEKHRRFGIDTPMQINHAIEVASILRHNIVQGARDAKDENAQWGMYCSVNWDWIHYGYVDLRLTISRALELRIHDDIERGDNDSVKIAGKKVKVDKPCSS